MSSLVNRVFCPECGAMRIRPHRSRFVVCPNGHGRLVSGFTKSQQRKAIIRKLPRAWRVGHHVFAIDGHKGRFAYRDGRQPAAPDAVVGANYVLARYVTRARTLIRVFERQDIQAT